MPATAAQVQTMLDSKLRPVCEDAHRLLIKMKAIQAQMGDVYDSVNDGGFVFDDSRNDNPPHFATKNDVLAVNTFISDMITALEGNAQLPVVKNLCVNVP